MRLIDVDKAYDSMLYEMCMTGYQSRALQVLKDEPIVEAIPITYIASWMGKHQGLEYDKWNLAVGTIDRKSVV